ncbi:type II secretion system F family protein [Jonesia quinghaiensis]|uniref:type II secretion system F family protein n=1 Tax=Jonesia quinghaiensis TaxID=262806 RepID=UPI00048DDBDC|nr:type II secretion system F family protein [Jonesia quinghaiensis]
MGMITGLFLGLGLLLIWMSLWEAPTATQPRHSALRTLEEDLLVAGIRGVSTTTFLGAITLFSALIAALTYVTTSLTVGAALAGLAAAAAPFFIVRSRATRQRARRREVWPDVVDHLISGVRAGLPLPEAVAHVGMRGPDELKDDFSLFAREYRATGRFDECLVTLKDRLADPTADRVIEALRVTRSVGGSEIGNLLQTLATFLRQDLRVRGELEARQSWTIGGARVAAAAPWIVLAMLATRPEAAAAFNTTMGGIVIISGAGATALAYAVMLRIGKLPQDERVLR